MRGVGGGGIELAKTGVGMSLMFEAAPFLKRGGFNSIVYVDQRPCGLWGSRSVGETEHFQGSSWPMFKICGEAVGVHCGLMNPANRN